LDHVALLSTICYAALGFVNTGELDVQISTRYMALMSSWNYSRQNVRQLSATQNSLHQSGYASISRLDYQQLHIDQRQPQQQTFEYLRQDQAWLHDT
jgi:outer membrane lipopolysaccharide assembly protein LptE/RlpB